MTNNRLMIFLLLFYIPFDLVSAQEQPFVFQLSCVPDGVRMEIRNQSKKAESVNTRMIVGKVNRVTLNEIGLDIISIDNAKFPFRTRHALIPPGEKSIRELFPNEFFGYILSFKNISHSYQLPDGVYSIQASHRNLYAPYDEFDSIDQWLKSEVIQIRIEEGDYKCVWGKGGQYDTPPVSITQHLLF